MDDSATPHDTHGTHKTHPLPASIVALVIVAIFTALFAKMNDGRVSTGVVTVTVLLAIWGLLWIWSLDSDEA